MEEVFRNDAKCFDIPSDIVLEASEFSIECKLCLEVLSQRAKGYQTCLVMMIKGVIS